jgi:serine/threonine-protein kinase RsbW
VGGQDLQEVADTLSLTIPRRAIALADVRTRLRVWLGDCGLQREDAEEFLVAVGEACANAILHAPAHSAAPIEVSGSCLDDQVEVRVTNEDGWRPKTEREDGGYGLAVMERLSDDLKIEQQPQATTITLRRSLA